MQIRIRPPQALSHDEIDLGRLDFPARWLTVPLPKTPKSQSTHACAVQGTDWCGNNGINAVSGSHYSFDRAVWAVTVIDTLLFDCDSGQVVVGFVQETEEEEYAIIQMNSRLLLDLRSVVTRFYDLPDHTDTVRSYFRTMLSFCMDLYSSYILHELKVTGHLPCNYFVWIAQMKRKGIARQTCLKAKEMADILYTQCGDKMDPELVDWVKDCIEETTKDLLDFVLAQNSRLPRDGPSAEASLEGSSNGPPSTPTSRQSDNSSEISDDSPTPAEDVDVYLQYKNDFNLSSDLLRHVDQKRMARLLPPKLSRRWLKMDAEAKEQCEELENRIAHYMNQIRQLERIIEVEEKKEKKLQESYRPSQERVELSEDDSEDDEEISEKTYNLRARSSTSFIDSHPKKKKRSKTSGKRLYRSASRRSKAGIKTLENDSKEWKRRQDSPYPHRHSEIITGKSAYAMLLPSPKPAGNGNMSVASSGSKRKCPFKGENKKLLDVIRNRNDLSMRKKLKLTIKFSGYRETKEFQRHDGDSDGDSPNSDESADPDWSEEDARPRKKMSRKGKQAGHRQGGSVTEYGDDIPPSTAAYLHSLRAPTSPAIGSRQISQRELDALSSAVINGAPSLHQPNTFLSPSVSSSSTSTSMYVDTGEDTEPGWEIRSRPPLSSRPLSQVSSRSNTPPSPRTPSQRNRSNRPPLRRESSSIHPNAFFVGLPEDFGLSTSSAELPNSELDIAVPELNVPDRVLESETAQDPDSSLTDGDELVLDILSPVREEEEQPLMDEQWLALDDMSSSPEDAEHRPGIATSTVQVGHVEDTNVIEAGATEEDTEVDGSGESDQGEQSEHGDPAAQDTDEEDITEAVVPLDSPTIAPRTSAKQPPSLIQRPEDIFDDESDDADEQDSQATIRRLRRSLHIDIQKAVEEEAEDEVNFVQELMEQCGMIVHGPGSPYIRRSVCRSTASPTRSREKDKDSPLQPRQRNKLKKKNDMGRPSAEVPPGPEAMGTAKLTAGLISADFARRSSISYLKDSGSVRKGGASPTENIVRTSSSPAAQSAPASLQKVQTRPVTVVYPSKHAKGKAAQLSSRSTSAASLSRPDSPYRTFSQEVKAPVGVHRFLDGFCQKDKEEYPESIQSVQEALPTSRHQRASWIEADREEVNIASRPNSEKLSFHNTPLTPVKRVKQKRYPGMLLSPEQRAPARKEANGDMPVVLNVQQPEKEVALSSSDAKAEADVSSLEKKDSAE